MAEPTFDRDRFTRALGTRHVGHSLIARAEVDSTNDVAWEALAQGMPDGTAVVADTQTRGRGRSGRTWLMAPGRGLALSLLLHPGCDRRQQSTLPLVAGLALAEALEALGARVQLKWPNDVLIERRKVAGILCESRGRSGPGDAVVIGVGVNIAQRGEDFPPELVDRATSLAIEGVITTREDVAAKFLNALEPLWREHAEGGRTAVLARWSERAAFWGQPVTVHTPSGPLTGLAQRLDEDGGLVLQLASGGETTVLAGDVEFGPAVGSGS